MNKFLIYIICLLNLTWSIGLDALNIPQKANILALSGSGIAGNIDVEVNPSSYMKPYLGFSNNTWLAEVSGQKSTWVFEGDINRFISFESLGVSDIEYQSDNDVEPEGYISANWYAIDFGSHVNLDKYFTNAENFQVGYNIKLNYSKLYIENSWGYTFDLGLTKQFSENLNIGFICKNLGKQFYSSSEVSNVNPYFGIGVSHTVNLINANSFYTDLTYHADIINNDDNNIIKAGAIIKFPYLSLMLGSSNADDYSDFSYGLSIEMNKWMIVFGSLNHENPSLGSPQSIELRKHF